ncbi:helix-turn-helix domain-containing protein [Cryobacterium sp. 10I1]|uniref:helix-turn-helix domain-containing protein n=1 Tax=Cryobacterium sp. 10I1 TaxID=3048578 RepID=UPI002B232132|nr:helix-turn-helix domain-containing protein [Cryobacterium sp. 10I1]MEB0306260.1 helix-turn-helix domain-containing protein [Cryobacterium sp. 10I1]
MLRRPTGRLLRGGRAPGTRRLFVLSAARFQTRFRGARCPLRDRRTQSRGRGKDLGGRPRVITDSQIRNARRLIEGGEKAVQVGLNLGMSRATFYRRARVLGLLPDQFDDETLTSTIAR